MSPGCQSATAALFAAVAAATGKLPDPPREDEHSKMAKELSDALQEHELTVNQFTRLKWLRDAESMLRACTQRGRRSKVALHTSFGRRAKLRPSCSTQSS